MSESIIYPDPNAVYIDEADHNSTSFVISAECAEDEVVELEADDVRLDLLILSGVNTDIPHLQL